MEVEALVTVLMMSLQGSGIPLDAYKVDLACGAVEEAVLAEREKEWILVEGQGSLLHPGSTATLPLMRGSCPTHLILCHRAEKSHLKFPENIKIPPLKDFIALNEALEVFATITSPRNSTYH